MSNRLASLGSLLDTQSFCHGRVLLVRYYKKAVTEIDPQKQLVEIRLALSALNERDRELGYGEDTSAERGAIFSAVSTVNNLRSIATEMIERGGGYLRRAA